MNCIQPPERIETDRLLIQRLRYEDADEIFYTYASKPEATRFVSWNTHQSVNDTRAFLQYAVHAWNQGTDFSYSVRLKKDNRLVGAIGLVHATGHIQVGYIFSPVHWRQGYATEVCKAVLKELSKLEGITRIGSFVDLENEASIQVLKKAGFVEEGLLPGGLTFPNQNNAVKACLVFRYPLDVSHE